MIDALTSLAIPPAARRVFFAGEQQEAQAARQILLDCGLSKRDFMAATYWTRDADQNRALSD
jgi:NADPH-dependent ferric siderophore reductase